MFHPQTYLPALITQLRRSFGPRLRYVGLQGSYLRGEATEDSDLDVMVVLDRLAPADLDRYRAILAALPQPEKACGFLCGTEDLARWKPAGAGPPPPHHPGLVRQPPGPGPCVHPPGRLGLPPAERGEPLPRGLPPVGPRGLGGDRRRPAWAVQGDLLPPAKPPLAADWGLPPHPGGLGPAFPRDPVGAWRCWTALRQEAGGGCREDPRPPPGLVPGGSWRRRTGPWRTRRNRKAP